MTILKPGGPSLASHHFPLLGFSQSRLVVQLSERVSCRKERQLARQNKHNDDGAGMRWDLGHSTTLPVTCDIALMLLHDSSVTFQEVVKPSYRK